MTPPRTYSLADPAPPPPDAGRDVTGQAAEEGLSGPMRDLCRAKVHDYDQNSGYEDRNQVQGTGPTVAARTDGGGLVCYGR